MSDDLVLVHVENDVGVLSFNRPSKHNALSDDLLAQWRAALRSLARDDAVQCIVLRGEGKSFSSGRDTTELGQRPPGVSDFSFVLQEQREALKLRGIEKPVVAALKGWVLGGALEVALHADVRVAATDADLGFPEIRFGIVPDVGGMAVVHALAGPERLKRMVMTGEHVDAQTAYAWGLVSEVVAPAVLDERTLSLARTLAVAHPVAVRRAKALIDGMTADQMDHEVARELRAQVELFAARPRETRE